MVTPFYGLLYFMVYSILWFIKFYGLIYFNIFAHKQNIQKNYYFTLFAHNQNIQKNYYVHEQRNHTQTSYKRVFMRERL